jgi:hypothetical protein
MRHLQLGLIVSGFPEPRQSVVFQEPTARVTGFSELDLPLLGSLPCHAGALFRCMAVALHRSLLPSCRAPLAVGLLDVCPVGDGAGVGCGASTRLNNRAVQHRVNITPNSPLGSGGAGFFGPSVRPPGQLRAMPPSGGAFDEGDASLVSQGSTGSRDAVERPRTWWWQPQTS